MFSFLWKVFFSLADGLLTFGKIVVDWFNRPLSELFANMGLGSDTILGEVVQAFLASFGGNITLLEFVLTTGIVFYIPFALTKFFVDLVT